MQKIECDRCKTHANAGPDGRIVPGWGQMVIRREGAPVNTMDLCSGCNHSLDQFMKQPPNKRA